MDLFGEIYLVGMGVSSVTKEQTFDFLIKRSWKDWFIKDDT